MSGFYSKMLVNTKIFGEGGIDDLLYDFAESVKREASCEWNKDEKFDKLIEEFSDEVGCRGDFCAAVRLDAGLNALLHDKKYFPIKIKFHRYIANQIQSYGADDNGNIISEYYIPEEGSENTSDEDDSIVCGSIEPEKVIGFADTADSEIINRASALIRGAGAMGKTITTDFTKNIYLNSNIMSSGAYQLQMAFELLNGCFTAETPVCFYDEYPGTFPNASVIESAKTNPEKYIVVELLFKD